LASNFPNAIDSIVNPNSTDALSNPSHSEQHIIANTAIEAIETKIGVDNSTDPSSLDYMIRHAASQGSSLGSGGNNSASEVPVIENPTNLDQIDGDIYGTIKYILQLTYNDLYYVSDITIFDSTTGIDYVESNIISNTNEQLATVAFVKNGSIISLVVTPENASVNARYYRTSLKK
jgi:hypothetical protein